MLRIIVERSMELPFKIFSKTTILIPAQVTGGLKAYPAQRPNKGRRCLTAAPLEVGRASARDTSVKSLPHQVYNKTPSSGPGTWSASRCHPSSGVRSAYFCFIFCLSRCGSKMNSALPLAGQKLALPSEHEGRPGAGVGH